MFFKFYEPTSFPNISIAMQSMLRASESSRIQKCWPYIVGMMSNTAAHWNLDSKPSWNFCKGKNTIKCTFLKSFKNQRLCKPTSEWHLNNNVVVRAMCSILCATLAPSDRPPIRRVFCIWEKANWTVAIFHLGRIRIWKFWFFRNEENLWTRRKTLGTRQKPKTHSTHLSVVK